MINRPSNWENVSEFSERKTLPLGAYICQIKKAQVESLGSGQALCVYFDIADGEYKGFYADAYKADTRQDKKWGGVLRVWLPRDDGSEKDEWTKSTLKGFITAVENSNPYHWNWDEHTLSNKLIGIIFRREEWINDKGETKWPVKPFRATSVDKIRSGDFVLPKDKLANGRSASSTFTDVTAQRDSYAPFNNSSGGYGGYADDGDLPF